MKSLFTFLLGAAVAVGGLYIYHKYGNKEGEDLFILRVPPGQRLNLTNVDKYEDLLKAKFANAKFDTQVNVKREQNSNLEETGPTKDNNKFEDKGTIGPMGSIHNTQTVRTNSKEDFEAVLRYLDLSSAETATATLTPTPTPAPNP